MSVVPKCYVAGELLAGERNPNCPDTENPCRNTETLCKNSKGELKLNTSLVHEIIEYSLYFQRMDVLVSIIAILFAKYI